MTATRKRPRALRTLTLTLVLALLAALLLAGSALAAGEPGKPTAKAPTGTITTVKPAFEWSKAKGAAKYELRVSQGSKLLLKKTGLKKTNWTSSTALPAGVDLTWKVRASNARGAGAWSRSLKFKIVPPSPAKAITAFSFQGLAPPVSGVIDEAAHTIAVTVPFGTDRSALVATFTTTGASVTVGATTQVSGTTANDFTSPVTYTVIAADASTLAYVVTVTVPAIGDPYGGGVIAYILVEGDPGYVPGATHGLIAAAADQTGPGADDGIQWALPANQNTSVAGAKGTAIGTGAANTNAIITQNGAGAAYAAGLARAYAGGGYSDWFLPSKDELDQLYLNRVAIGGFHTASGDWRWYWSSSQIAGFAYYAWVQGFGVGDQDSYVKNGTVRVRAVRAF